MREPILMVATGQKGVGKTFTTTQDIARYVQGNPATNKQPRKVLIYDINMEYTQYKAIAIKDLKKFTLQNAIEVRRVLPRLEDGRIADIDQMMMIMNKILSSYAGGMLILEDINRYLMGTQAQEIIGTLATNRHRDLDIIIHLQSLSAMTPRMFQNCSVVRFHKQQDTVDRIKDRVTNFELFKIAELLTHLHYYENRNERFYCYVSGEEGYIRGQFTKDSLRKACEKYAERYSPEFKLILRNSKKEIDPRKTALEKVTAELMNKYSR